MRGEVLSEPGLRVLPADRVSWSDLRSVFGERGQGARCWCQRYKLRPGESFASFPVEERADRLRSQAGCDDPRAETTSGLVGYLGDQAVAWCAVEPRPAYDALLRTARVPWLGREEERDDPGVWALTCLFVRAGFRRRGLSGALARAAVAHAREHGADALEAYPVLARGVVAEELHVGTPEVFAAAGLAEVTRPTPRRAVMRIEFTKTRSE